MIEQIKQPRPHHRILNSSYAYTSPTTKQLSSTFDDSDVTHNKRKSVVNRSFIGFDDQQEGQRELAQTSEFKIVQVNQIGVLKASQTRHISQKMLRIGRKQIDQPQKLLKNVLTDYENKVQEIQEEIIIQKSGFEQRIAAARAKRKKQRKQKQKLEQNRLNTMQQTKEQISLSFSQLQPGDQKIHWSPMNRDDDLRILAISPNQQNQSIGRVSQNYNHQHVHLFSELLKRPISSPNIMQHIKIKQSNVKLPTFYDSRRTRSLLNFSYRVAQQNLLHSMNQMPSAIMSSLEREGGIAMRNKNFIFQNQSGEYIDQQVYSSDEDDYDEQEEELMGENEIEQNIIQPMWSECEERFRLKQEKLEQMKEDVIQRNVNRKLSKVREITAIYNKKIKEQMDKKCTDEEIKQLQQQKQSEINLIKQDCDQIKAHQLENLKKAYEQKIGHDLMQDGEKEDKIDQLTSKLVHKLNNFQ